MTPYPNTPAPEVINSAEELAEMCGKSKSWAHEAIKNGWVPGVPAADGQYRRVFPLLVTHELANFIDDYRTAERNKKTIADVKARLAAGRPLGRIEALKFVARHAQQTLWRMIRRGTLKNPTPQEARRILPYFLPVLNLYNRLVLIAKSDGMLTLPEQDDAEREDG